MLVDALETGDNHHTTCLQVTANLLVINLQDTRFIVRAIRQNPHLVAGVRHRRHAALDQRHGQQGNRHLLTGGNDHVQLARNRLAVATDLLGQIDQTVGFAAHCRQHNHQVIAGIAEFLNLVGDLLDSLDSADRGASKFLYDQSHFKAASAHEGRPNNHSNSVAARH
ncbi:hypothetical protein D3C81_1263500 [compost metagenome]